MADEEGEKMFRHKHLFAFITFFDANGDGVLSWDDFELLAEKFTKIQRKGKVEKEVLERWRTIFKKWWIQLTSVADTNEDTVIEFDEWIKFFTDVRTKSKSYNELPEFLKMYSQLFFLSMDLNRDALVCIKDYKKYLKANSMDESRADDCFRSMLTGDDKLNGNALTSDRFKELVHDYWTSANVGSPGKYICGPFDSVNQSFLESKIRKK